MSKTDQDKQQQARIVGHTARMAEQMKVDTWKPPSEKEVDSLPPPSRRKGKGWKLSQLKAKTREQERRRRPTAEKMPDTASGTKEVPPSQPVAQTTSAGAGTPARPDSVQEGSIQALVWERPEDAARMVRTMLMEENGEGMPLLQEVAVLCVGLGQEVAAELMKHLSDYEIEEITQAIAGLKGVSKEMVDGVMESFQQHLQASEWIVMGGMDFARATLEKAVGSRKAREIIERAINRTSSGFYMLKNVAADQIAPFVSHEHPQTVALILSQLDPAQASGILGNLPARMQADVAYRIATMENITPNVIKQIEESLEASLRDLIGGNQDVGGPKVIADVLNLTGSSVEKNVLDQMDGQDPQVAEAVRNLMFVFADISKLRNPELQTLLSEVDKKDLVIALKGAEKSLMERIQKNVSEEVWKELTEEMEILGPMRLSEVEEVQMRVVQQVRQFEEQGKITIVRGDSDDQFV